MVWFDNTYGFKRKITLASAQVAGDEVDFPVLIFLTDIEFRDEGNGGHVKSANGYDMIFTNSAEDTQLKHEIERYTAASGEIIFWVKVPNLSGGPADTEIYIYYGKAGVVADPSDTGTWEANYIAVYHMDESAGNCIDSTVNGNDGTFQGSLPVRQEHKIGYSQYFDGVGDYISLPAGTFIATDVTVEMWQEEDDNNDSHCLYSCAELEGADSIHKMTPYAALNDVGYLYAKDGVNIWDKVDDNSRTTDEGFYAHMFDDDEEQLWKNNAVVSSGANGTLGNVFVPTQFWIGSARTGSQYYEGWIDEFRISDIMRSDNWMTTTYNTSNDPGTFLDLGSEATNPGGVACTGTNIFYWDGSAVIEFCRDDTSPVQGWDGAEIIGIEIVDESAVDNSPFGLWTGSAIKYLRKKV